MIAKFTKLSAVLVFCLSLLSPMPAVAAPANTASSTSCQKKAQVVNSRSAVLAAYKKDEDAKYKVVRNQWSSRISYAGQWAPKDAANMRDNLYKYDALHTQTSNELKKQIQAYASLKSHPLDCSNAKKTQLAKALVDVKGVKGKKVVGGNALISKDKKAETDFLNKTLKTSGAKMIKKLHKEKSKHPKPEHPQLVVQKIA